MNGSKPFDRTIKQTSNNAPRPKTITVAAPWRQIELQVYASSYTFSRRRWRRRIKHFLERVERVKLNMGRDMAEFYLKGRLRMNILGPCKDNAKYLGYVRVTGRGMEGKFFCVRLV